MDVKYLTERITDYRHLEIQLPIRINCNVRKQVCEQSYFKIEAETIVPIHTAAIRQSIDQLELPAVVLPVKHSTKLNSHMEKNFR